MILNHSPKPELIFITQFAQTTLTCHAHTALASNNPGIEPCSSILFTQEPTHPVLLRHDAATCFCHSLCKALASDVHHCTCTGCLQPQCCSYGFSIHTCEQVCGLFPLREDIVQQELMLPVVTTNQGFKCSNTNGTNATV